jgi:hypothetical protein
MPNTLSQQANKAAIDQVKREKPSQFTVGGHMDILSRKASGGITYDRKLSNGLGLAAYLRAWWHDAAVMPQDKRGVVVGGEITKKF